MVMVCAVGMRIVRLTSGGARHSLTKVPFFFSGTIYELDSKLDTPLLHTRCTKNNSHLQHIIPRKTKLSGFPPFPFIDLSSPLSPTYLQDHWPLSLGEALQEFLDAFIGQQCGLASSSVAAAGGLGGGRHGASAGWGKAGSGGAGGAPFSPSLPTQCRPPAAKGVAGSGGAAHDHVAQDVELGFVCDVLCVFEKRTENCAPTNIKRPSEFGERGGALIALCTNTNTNTNMQMLGQPTSHATLSHHHHDPQDYDKDKGTEKLADSVPDCFLFSSSPLWTSTSPSTLPHAHTTTL